MRNCVLTGILMLFSLLQLNAYASLPDFSDSTKITAPYRHAASIPPAVEAQLYRTFEGLNLNTSEFAITDPILVPEIPLADSILEKRNHAHGLLEKVLAGQRFLETLDALSEVDLPIGVVKTGGAVDYSILIDRINFTTAAAIMEVYVSLTLPQTGDRIAFNGKIPLSAKGGINGTAKVYLLGDHPIKISANSLLTLKGANTYVEFDCNGFKGVSVQAEVQFSRDLIIPEDQNGNHKPEPERVRADFTVYAQSLNDMMVGINIPAFQIKGLKGVGFNVSQAFMDWSDFANPPSLSFPAGYTSPFIEAGQPKLWQGFFLQRLEIRLPPSFKKKNDSGRIILGVERMIIDDQGFSGAVFAENIIDGGDMNGWGYSLDKIGLEIVTNQVKGFQLAGKLSVPVVKNKEGKATNFGYRAQRGADGNYIFAVTIEDELKLSLWAADVKIFPGSGVTVVERDNKFYPSATLNGELSISVASKGPKAGINNITFEQMVISTEAPYFKPGNFSFGKEGSSSTVSKFPLSIKNIGIKSDGGRVGLGFDVSINISGKPEEGGFGGTAGLIVWAKREGTGITDWGFDKVELTAVGLKFKKPGVIELEGSIRFFDEDPTYGDGFKGSLKGKIQSITVTAEALFGKTPAFRYWYADALVEIKNGVPIVPGVLSAFGFGGGFYSKMKQSTQGVASVIGKSASGITYVPDENTIGIRAIVLIGTPRPEAMNGDVALEVSLNRHGGINSVTFTGNANFMSPAAIALDKIKDMAKIQVEGKLADKLQSLLKGQVYGSVKLHFDNVNDVFHGNLEVYVNVGAGLVRGVSPGNKAGWAVVHFEKNDWYILIGTPDQPIGLEVAKIFKSRSYFMLGKNLPGSPPPPDQVSEILGNVDLDYMRDMNALESGMGFAFGLHFGVDTGNLRFLMFYGRFAAGTGVDFMLKDYGTQYHCAGSSGPMGINGWYANGQAYAFVMGKIGIRVKLRFYRGSFDILSIGAAAVLQTKGPNPFWMKGIVGGYYRILGGLVKGKCKFEVTVGKECKPVGEQNLLEDVKIIAEMSPATGATEVDVFNAPQVAFNIPVGEVFDIKDMENNSHSFRAVLDEFYVANGTEQLTGTYEWNQGNDVVIFDGHEILPGEKKLKVKVRLTFEERINGIWKKVTFEGKIVEERSETEFETGKAPAYIPSRNVSFSYPLKGQVNFYPQESKNGVIQLKDGQSYLFKVGQEWVQKIRFTEPAGRQYSESDVSYDEAKKRVVFTIPDGLQNSKVYNLEVLNIPRHRTVIDANVQSVQTEIKGSEDAGSATLTTKTIEGNLDKLEVKSLYASFFRTSKYSTFVQKMSAMSVSSTIRFNKGMNVFQLIAGLRGDELFDEAEINGIMNSNSLISIAANLTDNNWYDNYVYPLMYNGYPYKGWMRLKRRPNPLALGIPPVRDIYLQNFNTYVVLQDSTSAFTPMPFTGETVCYNLGESVAEDFRDLQHQAVNYAFANPALRDGYLDALILQPMPYLRYGSYRFKISYTIPGTSQATSSYDFELFNRIRDNE